MKRWYPDRIGGMFTDAEAVADLALEKPSVGMAEIGFICEPSNAHFYRASVQLGEQPLTGWAKHEHIESMGKQVFWVRWRLCLAHLRHHTSIFVVSIKSSHLTVSVNLMPLAQRTDIIAYRRRRSEQAGNGASG